MENTKDRELRIRDTFNSPINRMWAAIGHQEYIVHWWGPNGFTNTIHKMDFQNGGEWNFTMHGPDGKNFPNRALFKEIIPFKKIIFEHFNPHFLTTILFKPEGEKTGIDWTLLFDTDEMRETVVKLHKADEGQKQNLERLTKYLSKIYS